LAESFLFTTVRVAVISTSNSTQKNTIVLNFVTALVTRHVYLFPFGSVVRALCGRSLNKIYTGQSPFGAATPNMPWMRWKSANRSIAFGFTPCTLTTLGMDLLMDGCTFRDCVHVDLRNSTLGEFVYHCLWSY
jgi:hypothetical protein